MSKKSEMGILAPPPKLLRFLDRFFKYPKNTRKKKHVQGNSLDSFYG